MDEIHRGVTLKDSLKWLWIKILSEEQRMRKKVTFHIPIKFFGKKVIVEKDIGELLVYVLIILYTVVFSYFTIVKYRSYYSFAWDLGIFNQSLYTTLWHGKLFYSTVGIWFNPSGTPFGGGLVNLSLFLLLPVYAVYPSPETLLVVQSFILGLGALPLYWLARDELKNYRVAIFFALIYLLHPAIHSINWFDFHSEAFLPAFFLFSLYYLSKRRFIKYFVFIMLAMASMQNAALLTFFVGLYAMWLYRDPILLTIKKRYISEKSVFVPFITIVLSLTWLFLAWSIVNLFAPSLPDVITAGTYWSQLGVGNPTPSPSGTANFIAHVLLNPGKAFDALMYDSVTKFSFLIINLGSLLFLPLMYPELLLVTLPWFGYSFLSNNQAYYIIGFQYPAFYAPFFFASSVYGLKRLVHHENIINVNVMKKVSILLMAALLLVFSLYSPLGPISRTYYGPSGIQTITTHDLLLDRTISLIPQNASVLTQNNIFPQLSSRINSYVIPPPFPTFKPGEYESALKKMIEINPDYILLDLKFDPNIPFFSMLSGTDYNVDHPMVSADSIMLFKRGYDGPPVFFYPCNFRADSSNLRIYDGMIVSDSDAYSDTVLLHPRSGSSGVTFWYGPYEFLPPGTYKAVFRLKIGSPAYGQIITLDVSVSGFQLGKMKISGQSFNSPDTYQNFTLYFCTELVTGIEFRGIDVSSSTDIYLDYIDVVQTSTTDPTSLYTARFDGYSARFDGSTGYIRLATNALVSNQVNATITAWVRLSSNSLGQMNVYSEGDPRVVFQLAVTADIAHFGIWVSGTWHSAISTIPLTPNQFYFIACTLNQHDGMRIYVNSVLTGTSSSSVPMNGATVSRVEIGRNPAGTAYFKGEISNVQIYSTTLNSSQIKALYYQSVMGHPISNASLVGCWLLQQSSGSTVNDLCGLHDGILRGKVDWVWVSWP
jgi:uncharacterized membrane protein